MIMIAKQFRGYFYVLGSVLGSLHVHLTRSSIFLEGIHYYFTNFQNHKAEH